MYIFFLTVKCQVADSNVDGTPGNLFVLIYCFVVGDVGIGVFAGFMLDVNCTGYMTAIFFHSVFLTSAGFTNVRLAVHFFKSGPFVDCILFEV